MYTYNYVPARPAFVMASKGLEPEDSSEVSSIEVLTSSSFFLPKKYRAEEVKEGECDNEEEEGTNGVDGCRNLEDDDVDNGNRAGLMKASLHGADTNKATKITTERAIISIPRRD